MQTEPNHKGNMKRLGLSFLFLFSCTALLSVSDLYAQQGDAQSNLLPEIDPQDIEIRSEFTARFPGLRRQPILGFNPEPSVYQVDPNRQPFMETDEEVVANLPITDLSRPAPPAYDPLHYEEEIRAFGRAGAGSFVSPELEFWGFNRFSQTSYASGRLDYHSSDGHLDTENSSFRFFDADAEYATKINSNTSLKLLGGAESSFNRLFQLDNLNTLLVDVPPGPRKKYTGVNAGAALDQYKNSIEGWNADIGVRWFDMTMEAGDIGGSAAETVFSGDFEKEWAGSRLQETYGLYASGRGGSYNLRSQGNNNWLTLQAGGQYSRLLDYSTQVDAGAGAVYTSNPFEDKVYPGFSLSIKHWIGDNLTISGQLSGSPKVQTIENLHNLNRFLNHQTPLRHTYRTEAGGSINLEYLPGSSMYARVGYMQAQHYAYFGRSALPSSNQSGYYRINYMDANKVTGEVGATHQLVPEKFWIDARVYVQQPKLSNGNDIPFEESWGVNSGASAKFFEKLRIEAWADYVSERTALSGTTLGGFFMLGGQVDIQITDRIGVYAKMKNLLSQEYEIWDGYEERPFQAYGGVTIKLD
ncbi:hypothetical protein ACG2F4_01680 [Halalkalibaculum sp. DA3122]|uniref:hypothetical protein n=1 Tax=unclassified Halalkalibaculum TaxID=2964617 RepID=UPI0037552492